MPERHDLIVPVPALALPLRVEPSDVSGGWLVWSADGQLVAECEQEAHAVALALRANCYPALVAAVDAALPLVGVILETARARHSTHTDALAALEIQLLRARAQADGA